MYEFQYRPRFSSELKSKTVIGDHGDEQSSVFGIPVLQGDGPLVTMNLELGDLGSSLFGDLGQVPPSLQVLLSPKQR